MTRIRVGDRVEKDGRAGRVTFVSPRGLVADVVWDGASGPRAEVAETLRRSA